MKRTSILIAVFAVIVAASVAKANDIAVNFDGNEPAVSFAGLVAAAPAIEAPLPSQGHCDQNDGQESQIFFKLGKDKQQTLSASIIQGDFNWDTRILIGETKTDILYNSAVVYFVSKDGNKYVTMHESTDKRLITLLHKANQPALQTKNAVVCKFVEMVLWELVKGVWTEVIKQVKECSSNTDTDPDTHSGSGSTYHAGQGGGSNYDVNKLIH